MKSKVQVLKMKAHICWVDK